MVKRRTGLDPLAYMGVEPLTPSQFVEDRRNPTTNDYDNFNLMAVWLNRTTYQVWMLVDKSDFIATWLEFSSSVGGVNTLTGDVGGAVPPTAGNIDLQGAGPYIFTGNPGASLITLSDDGTVATTYDGDVGSAQPAGGILNIVGGSHLSTTAAGDTVTINLTGSIPAVVHTDAGDATPAAAALNVFGGNNITTTGAGNTVTIDVTGTTDHAVQIGNASGSLTSIGIGTNGQVLIGATGANPAFATLTSTGGSIVFTPGANSLNLEAAGAGALTSVPCDVGAAAPLAGVLNTFGGDNITTTGAGNTVTVAVSGTTQYAPQMGNAAGSLSDIGLMTDGELIIGVTGSAPNLARLSAGAGITIDDMSTPGNITISATNGGAFIQQVRTSTTSRILNTGEYWGSVGPGGANPLGSLNTPLLSEGTQIMQLTITPTSATSVLVIEANCMLTVEDGRVRACIYILQDAGTNAIASSVIVPYPGAGSTQAQTVKLWYYMVAGTTLATTFYLRMSETRLSSPSKFLVLNGQSGAAPNQFAGGTNISTFAISEMTS